MLSYVNVGKMLLRNNRIDVFISPPWGT
jgi:hypothetical protein